MTNGRENGRKERKMLGRSRLKACCRKESNSFLARRERCKVGVVTCAPMNIGTARRVIAGLNFVP